LDRSSLIAGTALGATAVLIVFAFVLSGSEKILQPEIVVTNGHSVSTVGEITPIATKNDLTLTQLFEQAESGVVRVTVDRAEGTGRSGVGSGFVHDAQGNIITNAHVVQDAQKITVTFLDGTSYKAKIVGVDRFTDIAVIKVDADPSLMHPLSIGDSARLKVGESVAAIGNPFGLSGSMTAGIVSQLGRILPSQDSAFSIPDVIQTDAAINPGNSGGPLLNMRGEVVGINTAIQSATGEFTGVGFAVPSKTIAKIVPQLIAEGTYHHPWMGIAGRDIDPDLANVLGLEEAKGFLVITVVEDSPADKAGIHGSDKTVEVDGISYQIGGDIIISVDRKEVRKIDDILVHLQREKAVGDSMVLQVLRDGRISDFTLILEERPQ
jgi:S1-C subfamily serine protease